MNVERYIFHPAIRPPGRIVPPHGWIGHIPFLQWLIAELEPRTFVELGVHTGNSFCAAAEALGRLEPPGRAYAVDSWQGDHQAGFYGEDVFADFSRHVERTFPEHVTIVRGLFSTAAAGFQPGSIDLLHIDGLHTYEAVAEDFRTWLPKMSGRGVILFHDIAETTADFGVWKLWGEVTRDHPSFSFEHNHGLGVLLVGGDVPRSLREASGYVGRDAATFRKIFEMHGGNVYRLALADTAARLERESARTRELMQAAEAAAQPPPEPPPGVGRWLARRLGHTPPGA